MAGGSPQGSLIPEAKAALVALLEGATWPAQPGGYTSGEPRPQISYGAPRDYMPDRLEIGDTEAAPGDQTFLAFDSSKLETFTIDVFIATEQPGLSCQQAVERAFGMFTVFAAVVRAAALTTPRLGVVGCMKCEVRQPRHREVQTPEGYSVAIETGVRVEAQVSPVVP